MRPITGSSKPPEERYPERCLRVMYIEDEYDKFQPLPPLIRKWEKNFTIDLCTSTQELQDFYKQCKDSSSQSGNRPYDVLIADCRMDRSGDESDQARLAGLRSAIAAAEQFPNHPAVVIPYTAYLGDDKEEWAFLKSHPSSTIYVLLDAAVGKHSMTMNDLLRDIVPSGYRTALKKGIENGSVHIPLPEAGRLLEWLDSSRSVMEEAGTKNITIHTGYERRSIGLDVLFLDQMNSADIPQIQGWINNIPRYSEEESARERAKVYWDLKHSADSRLVYRFIKSQIRSKEGELPSAHSTKDSILLDHQWLGQEKDTEEVLVLSIIFLVIREIAWRVKMSWVNTIGLDSISTREARASIAAYLLERQQNTEASSSNCGEDPLPKIIRDLLSSSEQNKEMLSEFTKQAEQQGSQYPMEVARALQERLVPDKTEPISHLDFLSLVDPLPGKWNADGKLDEGAKVGKSLYRKGLIQNVKNLLHNKRESGDWLSSLQYKCARLYASEYFDSTDDFPVWLSESR